MALGHVYSETDTSWAGPPVVVASGEVDLALAPTLEKCVTATLDSKLGVVVDLSGATFIDSVALGVLTSALQRCDDEDIKLYLIIADPRVMKVFELTGLASTFSIFESRDDVTDHLGLAGSPSS